ncbi:hypothetical protein TNCV_2577121 [Trichonephila clavipes]|nr:hypothetical protein TNCV_2577121 [Trichonephila clavipes]
METQKIECKRVSGLELGQVLASSSHVKHLNVQHFFCLPTDDVVSRVFIMSNASEQVVAIHPGIAVERAGLVDSQAKPLEVYSQKVMPDAYLKACNSLGSL